LLKLQVPYKFALVHLLLAPEKFNIEVIIVGMGVYREVTHPESGKIMEKMGALAWLYLIILQC
jgi:hypothetical protein